MEHIGDNSEAVDNAQVLTPADLDLTELSVDEIWQRSRIVQLPMNITFRGINQRELMLIEGPRGWAEWGAFLEYEPAEAATWLRCALEMGWSGPPPRTDGTWVDINGTIPACDPHRVPELLERYPGISTVKIKVAEKGQTLADDIARVHAARQFNPDLAIRIDANASWTRQEALRAAEHLTDEGSLDYIEQPCPTLEDLAWLREEFHRRSIPARIAADESIRKATDPYRALHMNAIDVAVVKAAPLGGPSRVCALARDAAKEGVSVTVSSAIDSVVGMYAGLSAASAIGSQPAGLATGQLLAGDVGKKREITQGQMKVEPAQVDAAALDTYAAPPERVEWWRQRLNAAWPLLQAS